MGLFVGNVHVQSSDVNSLEQRIIGYAAKLGLEPAGADASQTWTLAVAPGWVSVCDETSMGDVGQLEALAKELSQGTAAAALTIHDSDALCLSLARDGRLAARWSDNPELFGVELQSKWNQWIPVVSDTALLRRILAAERIFAEDALPGLAGLLGIPADHLQLRPDSQLPGMRRLGFRPSARPVAGARLVKADDPFGELATRTTVGDTLPVRIVLENQGEAFRGVGIELSGGALGLFTVGQAFVFDVPGPGQRPRSGASQGLVSGSRVAFDEFEVPPGPHRFGCSLMLHAVREGTGVLNVRAIAAGNPPVVAAYPVEIGAALPRPLRYAEGPNSMFYVKRMASPRILSGVAILTEASPAIVPAIERWVEAHGTGQLAILTVKHANIRNLFGSLPRPKKSKAALADKDWTKLTARLADHQTFSGDGGWFGFACQVSLDRETGHCPHVSFWVDAARETAPGLLDELLEEFMRLGALQAFTARWDWTPLFDTLDNYDRTPYEGACGAQNGRNYMGRRWCSRYLRAFGDRVWIGGTLGAHLDMAAVPGAERAESFWRVAGSPEAERALESLLATSNEYANFDETV